MKLLLTAVLSFLSVWLIAQSVPERLYDPAANASKDIAEVVKKAKASKKNVLLLAGGNWCNWCIEFNRFCHADTQVDSMLQADFIIYHLNYSKENRNEAVMAKFGNPQRFGFPVFIVLDWNGTRLHTQNSSYLEQGRSYHKGKVLEFLQHWNPRAVGPASYKDF